VNWYLGITTSKMISPFPGHAKIRRGCRGKAAAGHGAKGLARCLMRIANREAEMHLRPFRARLDGDNAKAMKIIDEGDKRHVRVQTR
jgi:hypothetical protein